MKKIERVLSIIVLLLENDVLSTAKLAKRFDVSKRTIFRDIETIEHAGFPVLSVPGRNGGFSLVHSFKMRTLTYSDEEKQAILNAINVKEELLGEPDQQTTIKEKISLMFSGDHNESGQLSVKSPTIHRPEIEKSIQMKLSVLTSALKNKQKTKLTYVDSRGAFTKRTVYPYASTLLNGSWYIFAYCEMRQDFRYFKITRIRKIEVLEAIFKKVTVSNKQWQHAEKMYIKLRFKRENLGMLYDYYLEDEIEVQDDFIQVSFYSQNLHTILPLLLMFGNGVQALDPEELRVQHQKTIENLVDTYKLSRN